MNVMRAQRAQADQDVNYGLVLKRTWEAKCNSAFCASLAQGSAQAYAGVNVQSSLQLDDHSAQQGWDQTTLGIEIHLQACSKVSEQAS